MRLLELYEDLFQYMCRLHRIAKTPAHPEAARVRSEVRELFEQVAGRTSSDVRLSNQVQRLELPLVFFVDNLICTSRLGFARQWADNRLARERNELAGDERFFDFLEEDLKDTSDEAAERLAVYYVCLGLGFKGMYQNRPEQLRQFVERIFPRVRQWIDSDPRTRISAEAYKNTDTRTLTEPPGNRIILVAIVFVFLSLSVLATYYGFYTAAVEGITDSVKAIVGWGWQ